MSVITQDSQWGRLKNGKFKRETNFVFSLKYHIKAPTLQNSGYLVNLTRHLGGKTGPAWFKFRDTKTVQDLTLALNNSFEEQRLFSSMKKNKMIDLLSTLDSELPEEARKLLVTYAGQQQDGTLVLAPGLFLDQEGRKINDQDSSYIWVPEWPSSPPIYLTRTIASPVSLTQLKTYLQLVKKLHANNAAQVILALASMIACSQYEFLIDKNGHFNLPVLTGPAMTGKTLAATCTAFIFGCNRHQIVSRATLPFLTEQFCSQTLPFVWDDPVDVKEVQQVSVDIGNGAIYGKMGQRKTPKTACLVTANFDMGTDPKYYSRAFQIRFTRLQRKKIAGDGAKLEEAARRASASLPILLQMGKVTKEESVREMSAMQLDYDIRIMDGVAVPLSICRKMLRAVEMEETMAEVEEYCVSPLHNQFPEEAVADPAPVPTDLHHNEGCVSWVKGLKTAGLEVFMEQKGDMLAIKTDAIAKNLEVKRPLIKKTVEGVNGIYGKMTRLNGGENVRCVHVPVTGKLLAVLNGVEYDPEMDVKTAEPPHTVDDASREDGEESDHGDTQSDVELHEVDKDPRRDFATYIITRNSDDSDSDSSSSDDSSSEGEDTGSNEADSTPTVEPDITPTTVEPSDSGEGVRATPETHEETDETAKGDKTADQKNVSTAGDPPNIKLPSKTKDTRPKRQVKPKQHDYSVGERVKAQWKSTKLDAKITQKTTTGLKIEYLKDGHPKFFAWSDVRKKISPL